jgi:tetratricopeptide (TPR) repeat protein
MANLPADIATLVAAWAVEGVEQREAFAFAAHLAGEPHDPNRWIGVAIQLRQGDHFDGALAAYAAAVVRFPTSHQLWSNQGILLRGLRRYDAARQSLERAIELKPDYIHAMEALGILYDEQGAHSEALAWYEKVIAIAPTRVPAVNNAANCFRLLGDTTRARDYHRRALEIDPDFPNALFSYASLLYQEQEYAAAEEMINHFLIADPGDRGALQLRDLIRRRSPPGSNTKVQQQFEHAWNVSIASLRDGIQAGIAPQGEADDRSVFLSYARHDPTHAAWVKRLSADLRARGFDVVLDRDLDLDVSELLRLGLSCANIVIVADRYYMESGLLGRIPVTVPSSAYPSFAFPAQLETEDVVSEVFKISAVTWEVARQLSPKWSLEQAAKFTLQIASPSAYPTVPHLRTFIEGWRVDESQLIVVNEHRYRAIVTAFASGEHCFSRYPIVDFSSGSYSSSVSQLEGILRSPEHRSGAVLRDVALWKLSGQRMMTLRPSFTQDGSHGGLFMVMDDWEHDPGPPRTRYERSRGFWTRDADKK